MVVYKVQYLLRINHRFPPPSSVAHHYEQPHPCVAAMSLEAAINLSVPELLRVLSEKLGQECTRVREIPLPPVLASIATLEAEVSTPWSISLNRHSNGI